MSDLIDRQALLKQIDIDSDGEPGYYGDTWKFIDTIKSMPPAELSTNLAEVGTGCSEFPNNSDAISRQAAIDAAQKWFDGLIVGSFNGLKKKLEAVPSAQPEIVRCKDCKHWIPYDWMFSEVWRSQNIDDYPEDEISCNYCDVHMKSSDFCSQAVRREVQDENDKTTNNTTNA